MSLSPSAAAVIVAAGQSTRMGFDKLFADLAGRSVLARAIDVFEACPDVAIIVLVASVDSSERVAELVRLGEWQKVARVCIGGARRQDSVAAGLAEVGEAEIVAIHDGARPLVSARMIAEGIRLARERGAAVPLVPIVDTIKSIRTDDRIGETVDRSRLRAAQTPQVFRTALIREAHRRHAGEATDDAAMVECLGEPVFGFPGDRLNLKITTPEDLVIARSLLTR